MCVCVCVCVRERERERRKRERDRERERGEGKERKYRTCIYTHMLFAGSVHMLVLRSVSVCAHLQCMHTCLFEEKNKIIHNSLALFHNGILNRRAASSIIIGLFPKTT